MTADARQNSPRWSRRPFVDGGSTWSRRLASDGCAALAAHGMPALPFSSLDPGDICPPRCDPVGEQALSGRFIWGYGLRTHITPMPRRLPVSS